MNAWIALVLVDVVAVTSLTRCFTGPGELTAAIVTLVAVHLCGLASRFALGGHRRSWRALGIAMAVFGPVVIVLGTSLFSGTLGITAWHLLGTDLRAAWSAFYQKVAPVPELPGLVIATAWAAGAVGVLTEGVLATRRIPRGTRVGGPAGGLPVRVCSRDPRLPSDRARIASRVLVLVPGRGRPGARRRS